MVQIYHFGINSIIIVSLQFILIYTKKNTAVFPVVSLYSSYFIMEFPLA